VLLFKTSCLHWMALDGALEAASGRLPCSISLLRRVSYRVVSLSSPRAYVAYVNLMQEFARVLKPGGLLVITDSSQLGDRPQMNSNMDNFTSLNEPHFSSYIRFNFGEEFKAVGLEPDLKCMQSATKSLSAIKPRV
jgi:SAM-dependent methyltransferase